MYEPKYYPELSYSLDLLGDVRFRVDRHHRKIILDSPDIESAHMHDHTEIFFNIGTPVSFLVGGKIYRTERGDAIIAKPSQIHVCIFETCGIHDYYCLWIDAPKDTDVINKLLPDGMPSHISLGELALKMEHALSTLEATAGESKSQIERTISMLEVFKLLSCGTENKKESAQTVMGEFEEILDDIQRNFAEIKTVNDIISRHFISAATLGRYFRKYIHLSPREYLESQKLACAAKLLLAGESVTDSCMHSGFSDCSHFISLFKKKFGTTPFKYKNQMKQ